MSFHSTLCLLACVHGVGEVVLSLTRQPRAEVGTLVMVVVQGGFVVCLLSPLSLVCE